MDDTNVKFQLETGSDLTMINEWSWIKIVLPMQITSNKNCPRINRSKN